MRSPPRSLWRESLMNKISEQVMKSRNGRTRTCFQRRGATAVEFALVGPALFIVILCCAEFARLSMMRNLANNAAYDTPGLSLWRAPTMKMPS